MARYVTEGCRGARPDGAGRQCDAAARRFRESRRAALSGWRALRHSPCRVRRTSLSDAASTPVSAPRSRESKDASLCEELLKRFPEWTVDLDNAKLSSTSTVRGWDNLPAFTEALARKRREATAAPDEQASSAGNRSRSAWRARSGSSRLSTPMGPQVMTAADRQGTALRFTGNMSGEMGAQDITGEIAGRHAHLDIESSPSRCPSSSSFDAKVEGDTMTGSVKLGMFGKAALTGKRTG